jgi:hypothetical protein
MEYDTATTKQYAAPEAENYAHESTTGSEGQGHLRVKGSEVDISPLKESITFPFSGQTAKNRFLKAPMTERLWYVERLTRA